MDFARKQLSKHGWTEGQGLGKDEGGIKEAVKVKLKQDKKGVGHDPGEEFSFHWWDHIFNKAASKIEVNTTEDGVEIKNSGDTKVSKKKGSKTYDNKAMLYGQFVKGSTLSDGLETREKTLDSISDEEAEETTQCLMPDQEEVVFKMCGGRTAHKGARHGLKLNGKLLRIQEQEKLLLDSVNSKLSNQKDRNKSQDNSEVVEVEDKEENGNIDRNEYVKKSKKRKKKLRDAEMTNEGKKETNADSNVGLESYELKGLAEDCLEDDSKPKKRKKSKKNKKENECDLVDADGEVQGSNDHSVSELGVVGTELTEEVENALTENSKKKKKKKKKGKD